MNDTNIRHTELVSLKDLQPHEAAAEDFDFLEGRWKVHNKRLITPLRNARYWEEFGSILELRKILNGLGNIQTYSANFDGEDFEEMIVRIFDPSVRQWTVHTVDTTGLVLRQEPLAGGFVKGLGRFYRNEYYQDREIRVLNQWNKQSAERPEYRQAFSMDGGECWEWNWIMMLSKISCCS